MPAASPAAPRPLVIVVDDAHPLRLVMSRALTDAGCDVLTVPDGYSATVLIQGLRTPPDLVVSDLRMPVMGGEELAAWLTAHYPRLPVVFVSAFGMDESESLPGPLLRKPFTMDELCAVVGQRLASVPKSSAVIG